MTKGMKHILGTIAMFLFWLPSYAQPFVHPGIDMNASDLDYMRAQVLAGIEPWKSSFEQLEEQTPVDFSFKVYAHVIRGPYNNPDVGSTDLLNSSQMAYNAAVMWYVTGEEKYAKLSLDIIERWASVLRSFDENDAKLLVALTGYKFCNAAEILRYNYPGWKDEHTESVSRMLMSAFYPTIRYYFSEANGNWDGAIVHTLMAIAIFTDRRDLFDNAVDHFLHARANGSMIKYIYPSGQCQETERDQGHVQMGLFEFASAARVAYTQGVDLFSVAGNRLALGLEYTAKFVTGHSVEAYGIPSERYRTGCRKDMDYFLDHYTAKGIEMPFLRELCARAKEQDPKASPLARLTAYRAEFADKPAKLVPPKPSGTAPNAGAKPDGSAPGNGFVELHPSDSLQQALNEYAGTGKTLFLRAGEYRLTSSLKLPSDIRLYGEGQKTVIICEPSVRTAAILLGDLDAKNITIENLVIEGASSHSVGSDRNSGRFKAGGRYKFQLAGISLRGEGGHKFSNILLKDLTVINFSRSGVYVSDADGLEIDNCDFTGNGSFVVPGPKLQHNLYIHHSEKIRIRNSRFDTSLYGCGLLLDHCRDWSVDSCEIARNGWHGVMVAECRKGRVENCLIEGNDACGVMAEYLYNGSSDIRISRNVVQCNADYGVKSFSTTGLTVSDNRYSLNGQSERQEYISSEKHIQLEQLLNR